ncbi:hypothetical protein [Aminobacter aganoensis]
MLAIVAAWRRLAGLASGWHRALRWGAMAVLAVALGIGTVAAGQHARHYLERADTNRRSILAEILAQPICSGEIPATQPG